jgi:hypothetical protein
MLRKYIQDVALLFDFQDTLPVRKFAAASSNVCIGSRAGCSTLQAARLPLQ